MQDGLLEEVQWLARELKLNEEPPAGGAAPEGFDAASRGFKDDEGLGASGHDDVDRMRGGVLQGIGEASIPA